MKKVLNIKYRGFTLIELLVSITVFVLVFLAAIGIFTYSMKGKMRVNQLKEIEDNARYAMEMMSREIRMAKSIDSNEADTFDSEIDFTNSDGDSITYAYDINKDCLTRNSSCITSDKVNVGNLIFYVNDFDLINNPQPRVTISMTIASTADTSVNMGFQTSISPKIYKKP